MSVTKTVDESVHLYRELLKSCDEIKDYTANSKTFSGKFSAQFEFQSLNEDSFDQIYAKKNEEIIPRQGFFSKIPNFNQKRKIPKFLRINLCKGKIQLFYKTRRTK